MPERIDVDVVGKVSRLARLDLTPEEIATTTGELARMLDHFADMDALDLEGVEPMAQPYPLVNVLREDVVSASLERAEVLAAAPEVEDDRFRVPPIIGLAD